jgi:hypothetical protein
MSLTATAQLELLKRIEANLADAKLAAGQLPGGQPLLKKLVDAESLASAWRWDQEAELPERETTHAHA